MSVSDLAPGTTTPDTTTPGTTTPDTTTPGTTTPGTTTPGTTTPGTTTPGTTTPGTTTPGTTTPGTTTPGTTTPGTTASPNILELLLTKSNFILLVWFLVVYILAYFVLGMFFGSGPTVSNFQSSLGRLLDIMVLCGLLGYAILYYYYAPSGQIETDSKVIYEQFILYLNNSYSILTTAAFIVMFYVVIYLIRVPMSAEAKPIFISLIENTSLIGLLLVSIVAFFKHALGISFDDLFDKLNPFAKTEVPIETVPVPLEETKEVFNVSNNLYTYDEAQAVCNSFGAQLATYDQIETAYNNGAEWCAYGWSEDQMAYFPTQKSTWSELQKNPKQKNNCGRPGVNGGYIANPYIKFGVNCYGKKPEPTAADLTRLDAKLNQVYPKSDADKELDQKVEKWKENSDKFLQVSSYNTKKWSRY